MAGPAAAQARLHRPQDRPVQLEHRHYRPALTRQIFPGAGYRFVLGGSGRPCRAPFAFLCCMVSAHSSAGSPRLAVVVPFESPSSPSIERLIELVAPDLARVNATILSRTGSEVTMIPE